MKQQDYLQCQCQLRVLATVIKDMPLKEFLFAIDRADTLGPIVDPTLYKHGMRALDHVHDLADAARTFQVAVRRLESEVVSP